MLATFAASDAGRLFGRSCVEYGVDPAASIDDDVLAANLRIAMLAVAAADTPNPEPERTPDGAIKYEGGVN